MPVDEQQKHESSALKKSNFLLKNSCNSTLLHNSSSEKITRVTCVTFHSLIPDIEFREEYMKHRHSFTREEKKDIRATGRNI